MVQVDGDDVAGLPAEVVAAKMRGPAGSAVQLGLRRGSGKVSTPLHDPRLPGDLELSLHAEVLGLQCKWRLYKLTRTWVYLLWLRDLFATTSSHP